MLDKNLSGEDYKRGGMDSTFKKKERDFNEGVKGFKKKYPTVDDERDERYDSKMSQQEDLNDIEEEEIDYKKRK